MRLGIHKVDSHTEHSEMSAFPSEVDPHWAPPGLARPGLAGPGLAGLLPEVALVPRRSVWEEFVLFPQLWVERAHFARHLPRRRKARWPMWTNRARGTS